MTVRRWPDLDVDKPHGVAVRSVIFHLAAVFAVIALVIAVVRITAICVIHFVVLPSVTSRAGRSAGVPVLAHERDTEVGFANASWKSQFSARS